MRVRIYAPLLLCCTVVVSAIALLESQQTQPLVDPAFQQQFKAGRDALETGKYEDAIAAFKKANKLQKNACTDCYLGMAAVYLRWGDLDKVLENCDKALSAAGDDSRKATAHSLKGKALTIMGATDPKKMGLGEIEYRAAVGLTPGAPSVHMNLAVSLLRQSKDDEAIAELKKCLTLGPDQSMAEQAKLLIAEPRRGREDFAPEFHFTSMQGQDISLKQLGGKIVVLDFWATWCPPCRESVPELKALTKKYSSDKLALISVSADKDEEAWQSFTAKKGMDWPQFRDADHKILDSFSVRAFPTYLVIDGEGIIRKRIVGMNPQESIVHRLKEMLTSMSSLQSGPKN